MFWSTFLHISFQEILLFNPSLQRWMSWVWVQLADITKILLMLQTDDLGENSSKNTKNKNITYLVLFTFLIFLFLSLLWSFSLIPSLHRHINEQTPLPPLGALSHLISSLHHSAFNNPVFYSWNLLFCLGFFYSPICTHSSSQEQKTWSERIKQTRKF